MSDSDSIRCSLQSAWHSERLMYRAIEDNDADRTFMQESIMEDPSCYGLWHGDAFQPRPQSYTNGLVDNFRERALSVMICLPVTLNGKAAPGTDEVTMTRDSKKLEDGVQVDHREKLQGNVPAKVPIGILLLTAPGPAERQHRKTKLGIALVDAYQGKGYGPEAINWALDWAFKFGGMHRVRLECFGFNDRGQRVYERIGFVKEGVERQSHWFDRGWHDTIMYGMLESEWEALRRKPDNKETVNGFKRRREF